MEYLAVFAPLCAFLSVFLLGQKMGPLGAQIFTCGGVILAAIASCVLFVEVALNGQPRVTYLLTLLDVGSLNVDWAIRLDTLSVVMMCVITVVSACVHVYSIGYMSHDPCRSRFMSYLSLFTFAMLVLVTADNLLQLFFGWEGVGLASYLLIGFWNHKDSANAAAIKAFIVNRIGDAILVLGLFTLFSVFGTIQFDEMFLQASSAADQTISFIGYEVHALTLACLLLFIGACGKSAQLGLHTWLPDAMEGPTPVSALIHAATMVTAGIFLIARFSPVFEYAPDVLMLVTVMGATTAFVAATIGMTQFDIKRVIAYSTMSQLGYMFFALGVSAYGAAMFHLMTHAFFKALLFLGAGSVIHAMGDEQDMRRMGGIWKKIPVTYGLMWIGSMALAGIPLFSGYYSKDVILEAAWADQTWFGEYAYWMGTAAALMTAFYSWRLILMTFHGKPRAKQEVMEHIHESPQVMLIPLYVLAAGALFAGAIFYQPFVGTLHHGHNASHIEAQDPAHDETHLPWSHDAFWSESIKVLPENDTVEAAHNVSKWVKYLPVVMAVLGILLGYVLYLWQTGLAPKIARAAGPIHTLLYRKWFFDEIYNYAFVQMAWKVGRAFAVIGDKSLIDGLGADGMSRLSLLGGRIYSAMQSGYIYHYAFVMMVGLVLLLSWILWTAGGS